MKTISVLATGAALAFAAGLIAGPAQAQETTLNVASAGSQNMVDYVTDYLGPMFEKANPGVKVRAVGTGPGDAGAADGDHMVVQLRRLETAAVKNFVFQKDHRVGIADRRLQKALSIGGAVGRDQL